MEGAPAMIVTAETRDIWKKIQIQSTKSRFKTHHLKKSSHKIF